MPVVIHECADSQATTAMEGMMVGFWAWLGFVATIMLGKVIWEMTPVKLYGINVAYYLVSLLLMGAILAVM